MNHSASLLASARSCLRHRRPRAGPGSAPRSRSISSAAGVQELTAIAVPAMPVAGGSPSTLGRQIAEVIASDLRSTGALHPARAQRHPRLHARPGRGPGLRRVAQRRRRRSSSPARSSRAATAGSPSAATSTTSPPGANSRARASRSTPPTGAAPRTNAPTRSIRACRAQQAYPRHPHRLRRRDRPQEQPRRSASRSWIRTAPTTAI